MAQQIIDATEGAGESLPSGFVKVNANFTELYGQTGNIENDTTNRRFITDTAGGSAEAGLTEVVIIGGRNTFPNIIGSASATIQGVAYAPGSTWGADSSYVAGFADVASIHGGYDSINNQEGGTILHSDHSHMQYHSNGHSCILGGSYVLLSAARSCALGSRNTAVEGNVAFAGAFVCDGTVVSADHGYAMGKDLQVRGGYSLAVGRDVDIASGHDYSRISGRDATSPGLYSDTHGHVKMVEVNDARRFRTLHTLRTTTATLTNMSNMLTMPSGKVITGVIRARVVAMRDGSADANNDASYLMGVWESTIGFRWDGTNGYFFNSAGVQGPSTAPTLDLTTVRDDITVGAAPHIAINGGLLRPKVTGVTSVTINWLAELDVLTTLVS